MFLCETHQYVLVVAINAIQGVCFGYLAFKQMNFIVLNPMCQAQIGNWWTKDWFLIEIGLE